VFSAAHKTAKPFQRKLISRSDVKARSAVLKLKKRHVEVVTRLPTERLATACWAFIVVKRTGLEPAPVLVFRSLQRANRGTFSTGCSQACRHLRAVPESHTTNSTRATKTALFGAILALSRRNPEISAAEVIGH
jgi:hypothetical protein